MDSFTQIVLGAAVAEAVAGRKMGNKAAMWGAIAGTIPDLDVLFLQFYHPIDAAIVHRGFSHSIIFAFLMSPILGWLIHLLYKKRYDQKMWTKLFFFSIITHPMLDVFTNYGTEFLWPFKYRITFNTIFVLDPLYTVPFFFCLLVALFLKREKPWRRKWNWIGIWYSCGYLLWGVIVKLTILFNSTSYFKANGLETKNEMVTPMPLTSFYWMILAEDKNNYYVGYKSLFYRFDPHDIDTIPKNKSPLNKIKWPNKNYSKKLEFISNGYYTCIQSGDTLKFYDLRFGVSNKMTNDQYNTPIMGYGIVIDNSTVQKTFRLTPSDMFNHVNFDTYVKKIFHHE